MSLAKHCVYCGDGLDREEQVTDENTGLIYCTQECLDLAREEAEGEDEAEED